MDLQGLLGILESITAFQLRWRAHIERFHISGGDPLLHGQWYPFLKELRDRNKQVTILGNPEMLTGKTLGRLASLRLRGYQMSLDGLESTHDQMRSKGSFKRTVKAIDRLSDHAIPVSIMCTIFPENMDELIPLLRFVATKTRARKFVFDLGAAIGNAQSLEKTNPDPRQLKELFIAYIREKQKLQEQGHDIMIAEKSHFFRLIRFEGSSFYPFSSRDVSAVAGCNAGWSYIAILSDGTVLPCRRCLVKAGKMPEQSFEEIFLQSEVMKRFRRPESFAGCGTCSFYLHCRGCPAMVSGQTGDPFAANAFCFRHLLKRDLEKEAESPATCPPEAGPEEEHRFVARHFHNVFAERFEEFRNNAALQQALKCLSRDEGERRSFFESPDSYLRAKDISLDGIERLALNQFLLNLAAGSPNDYRNQGRPCIHHTKGGR